MPYKKLEIRGTDYVRVQVVKAKYIRNRTSHWIRVDAEGSMLWRNFVPPGGRNRAMKSVKMVIQKTKPFKKQSKIYMKKQDEIADKILTGK